MRRVLRFRPSPAMIVAFVALIAATGGTGYAALNNVKKTAAQFHDTPGWLPGESGVGYTGIGIGQRICTSSPQQDGNEAFSQRLELPDGAKITKLTFYYFDYNPSAQLEFNLFVGIPGLSDDLDTPHAFSTTVSPPSGDPNPSEVVQNATITLATPITVDNSNSYGVGATFESCNQDPNSPNFLALDGVRVDYQLP